MSRSVSDSSVIVVGMKTAILVLIALAPLWAQQKKSIFLITDAEGVAGVCRQDQTDPKDAEMRQLLTGEINAAVAGFLAGGADDVVVWDGHDGSQTLSTVTIHPKARLVMGSLGPTMLMERGFSAVAFVGQHARADSKGGVMAHSYSSLGIQKMLMNGKPVGEIETRAALAGAFGVPVIMLSGDQAAAADLKDIVPAAETAVVKEGLGYYSCISLSAAAARDLIREKAVASMRKLGQIPPYKVEGPVTIEVEYSTRHTLSPDAALATGAELIDARTIRYSGKDFMEAWTRSRRF
jgi:D-amino peptidase